MKSLSDLELVITPPEAHAAALALRSRGRMRLLLPSASVWTLVGIAWEGGTREGRSQTAEPQLEDGVICPPCLPTRRVRTLREDSGVEDHRPPSQSSKMVLSIVKKGPLEYAEALGGAYLSFSRHNHRKSGGHYLRLWPLRDSWRTDRPTQRASPPSAGPGERSGSRRFPTT